MEHQVFVPVPADRLRAVLRDPARVARCVPGLQPDAAPDAAPEAQAAGGAGGAGQPLPARMRLKVGSNTVTYRGTLTVTEQDPDHFTVSGEGTEIRGSGTVTLAVGLRLAAADGGTSLEFTAGGEAGGRAAGFAPEAVRTAVQRLLDRAAAQLAALAGGQDDPGRPGGAAAPAFGADALPSSADPLPGEALDGVGDLDGLDDLGELGGLGDLEDIGSASDFGELDRLRGLDGFAGPPQPPAEAAHARRTMIGRSAEEVDHAPPRGRYAPVPAAASATAGAGLRWLAPAAALALASAVVLGRALRRRR
ncbi:SRPBCC domain-containing protein [Streptomyces sp. NPDC127106]|uniref:SRPBCC domain-containing protein n=1 Tax=Streptomyces sp. NPDC127106 TaxID=3345360 RepID=UPI0036267F0E